MPAGADVVVLDDAGLGFRTSDSLWPDAVVRGRKPRWVVVKMASPVAEGPLWEHLAGRMPEHLIAIMTVDDLRKTSAHISRELSWERTAQDLFWELTNSSSVAMLKRCAHVIVSLGTAGAFWLPPLEAGESSPKCQLIYDPASFEGMWDDENLGAMIGFTNCLTAGVCRALLTDVGAERPDLGSGIRAGISAMRALRAHGYGTCRAEDGTVLWPEFPTELVVEALGAPEKPGGPLYGCSVPDPVHATPVDEGTPRPALRPRPWSILDDKCKDDGESLHCKAASVVTDGLSPALYGVPLGRFGKLTTADRREIEGYRTIRGMLAEYCRGDREKPVSIAVFGPPGSGKSFGVKQVAKSISSDVVDMVFNLSQFDSPTALIDALHQVRDVGLSGKIPLVFWDEFDASRDGIDYAWLRYFLAPMQDGEFQSGQITHHIGRAIFVFAGGTSESMSEFSRKVADETTAKGPDFVSRLKGYMDVLGPNPLDSRFPEGDPHCLIRRAIVLRSILGNLAPQLFSRPKGKGTLRIDSGVLAAFLQTSEYKHGVRSMESIIAMSALWGREKYERSSLPSREQLDVHVDGLEFLALAQQPDFSSASLLESAARKIHERYRLSVKKLGGKRKWDVPYDELPENVREDNRNNVREIPMKLASTGLAMIPARGGHAPVGFTEVDVEKMAEQEPLRWMKAKVADGWTYGPKRDEAMKKHPDLRPWRKLTADELGELPRELVAAMKNTALPEKEKEIDRELSRSTRELAVSLGYAIVALPGSQTG